MKNLSKTLPPEWQNKLLGLKPTGPESLVIKFLQEYVQEQPHRAIEIKAIQLLAEWATGPSRSDSLTPFPVLRNILSDLEKLVGIWSISTVIDERKKLIKGAHPIELSRELDSCLAEWRVLHYLIQREWSAVKRQREKGSYDWFVTKGNHAIDVEVKQKAAIGSAGQALEWCLQGLALLPEGFWMHRYSWNCRQPRTTHLKDVELFADEMNAHLKIIERAIEGKLEEKKIYDDSQSIPGTKLIIEAQLHGNQPVLELSLAPDSKSKRSLSNIRLVVEPSDNLNCFSTSGDNSDYVLSKLGDCEVNEVKQVLNRLGASAQGAKRSTQGLYVFVWWIPIAWEDTYKREWLRKICDQMAQQPGLKYVAVWPCGHFTAAYEPWILSTDAMVILPGIAP